MSDTVMNFVIQKAVTQLCEEHNWNIHVESQRRLQYYSPKESEDNQHHAETWKDTTFKVCLLGQYQGVELHFYGLRYEGDHMYWREIGISYDIQIHEDGFPRVAELMAMTPFMIQALKKSLNRWAERVDREVSIIVHDKEHGKTIEEQKQELYAERQKIAARDPKLAPYYHQDNTLEIREFLLTYLGEA